MKVLKKVNARMGMNLLNQLSDGQLTEKNAIQAVKQLSKDFKIRLNGVKSVSTDIDSSGLHLIVEFSNGIVVYGLYDAFGNFRGGSIESKNVKEPNLFYYSEALDDDSLPKIVKKINNYLLGEIPEDAKDYLRKILNEVKPLC